MPNWFAPGRKLAFSTLLLSSVASVALAQNASDAINAGEINASGGGAGTTVGTQLPTPQQVFALPQTVRVIDPQQTQSLSPLAGGPQALSLAPGAYVNGYGGTGATKYTIALDGIGQGWGGYGGYTGGASLMITLDGVPLVDPATGLWASASIPAMSMFQGTTVTYGPGSAKDRWYDNIGGQIEFTPLAPTATAGGTIGLTYGSYNAQMVDYSVNSGTISGWSTILAGQFAQSDSYRVGPDGFANPSNDYAIYGKTVKQFDDGDLSFGVYGARSAGYRPQVIPTQANPGISINGTSAAGTVNPGTLYSQQTSGFYSTPAFANYEKWDVNQLWTVYSKYNRAIDDSTAFHNLAYYVREDRLHSRLNDAFPQGASNVSEYNNPYSYWFGDKMDLTRQISFNTFDIGGFAQYSLYNTQQSFYNNQPPFNGSRTNPTGHYRSGNFSQIDTGVFVQDDIQPIKNLHIVPGIRYVGFDMHYADMSGSVFPNAPAGNNQGALNNGLPGAQANTFTAAEPSIEANWQALPWLNLYASYEVGYKTPQVGGGGGLYQSIAPQYAGLAKSAEYQVGFKIMLDAPEYGLRKFDVGANYFYLNYSNQTIQTALANGTAATSFGTSYYQGINFFADDNITEALHTFVNASIVNAVYTSYMSGSLSAPTYFNGSHVPYVPSMTLNVGADYKFPIGQVIVDPYMLYQYSGAQYIFNNVTVAPSSQQLAAYGTLNVGVNAKVPFTLYGQDRALDLSLSVLNATGNKYNAYLYISSGGYFGTPSGGYGLAYPGAPTTVYASVGVSF